jgi:hypothetical protein
MKERSRDVVGRACRHCHAAIVDAIEPGGHPGGHGGAGAAGEFSCIRCHRAVGHP